MLHWVYWKGFGSCTVGLLWARWELLCWTRPDAGTGNHWVPQPWVGHLREYLFKKGQGAEQQWWKKCEKQPCNTNVREGEGEGASGTRAEISLQPMVEIQLEERKSMRKEQQREAAMDWSQAPVAQPPELLRREGRGWEVNRERIWAWESRAGRRMLV